MICCATLGVHATGDNHGEAVELLKRVDVGLSKDLATLLRMKTRSGYSHVAATTDDQKRASRAAAHLIDAMRAVPAP